jgi:hypothetical protein
MSSPSDEDSAEGYLDVVTDFLSGAFDLVGAATDAVPYFKTLMKIAEAPAVQAFVREKTLSNFPQMALPMMMSGKSPRVDKKANASDALRVVMNATAPTIKNQLPKMTKMYNNMKILHEALTTPTGGNVSVSSKQKKKAKTDTDSPELESSIPLGTKQKGSKKKNTKVSTHLLEKMVDVQKTQQLAPLPQVEDISKIQLPRNSTYTFLKTTVWGNVSVLSDISTGIVAFDLSSVPDYLELVGLFGFWRIQQATVKFIPVHGLGTIEGMQPLETTIDYFGDTTREYSVLDTTTHRSHPPCAYAERTVMPKYVSLGATGTSGTSKSLSSDWCDTEDPYVRWCGVRWYLDVPIVDPQEVYIVEVDYVLNFKECR